MSDGPNASDLDEPGHIPTDMQPDDDERPIVHVRVGTESNPPRDTELKRVRQTLQNQLPEYEVVISTPDVALHELPALDDYANELADRVAERINDG